MIVLFLRIMHDSVALGLFHPFSFASLNSYVNLHSFISDAMIEKCMYCQCQIELKPAVCSDDSVVVCVCQIMLYITIKFRLFPH